jgi:hypothetical protein
LHAIVSSTSSIHLFSRYVIANDLSPAAVAAMKRNVEFNGLGPTADIVEGLAPDGESSATGKVRVTETDAWYALRLCSSSCCLNAGPVEARFSIPTELRKSGLTSSILTHMAQQPLL